MTGVDTPDPATEQLAVRIQTNGLTGNVREETATIRRLDAEILLHGVAAAVADDPHDVAARGELRDHLGVLVHDADVMSLFTELPGQGGPHLAAAHHYDFHNPNLRIFIQGLASPF